MDKNRSPLRLLSAAWLITLVALVAFLWCAYDSYKRFKELAERNLRIAELRGQIIHLDEVLTMSARMNALTGDAQWEERYKRFEPDLEKTIRELLTYSLGVQASKETDDANEALVKIEDESFALVKQAKQQEARALLLGKEYLSHKAIYTDGMDKLGRKLAESAAQAMQVERQRIYLQLAVGAGAIVVLVAGWLVAVRVARQGMRTRAKLDKVERDLNLAREIQRGLLPRDVPDTPGFEIDGWSKPADQTGGDYFDWMTLPDGGTLITLADVTGHGIGPALIVSVCRAYIRAAAGGDGVALGAAISRVNDLLQVDLPAGRFVTAAAGVLYAKANTMSLISAGQAPMFFYHAATGKVDNWAADDLPLGVASNITFETARTLQFEPGDVLVLATDGFFEWANASGEQFGIDRLEAFVAARAHEPSKKFIEALHAEVIAHAAGQVQPDDLTVVIVRRKTMQS